MQACVKRMNRIKMLHGKKLQNWMQRNKKEGKTKSGASIKFIVSVYLSFLIYKISGYKINEISG